MARKVCGSVWSPSDTAHVDVDVDVDDDDDDGDDDDDNDEMEMMMRRMTMMMMTRMRMRMRMISFLWAFHGLPVELSKHRDLRKTNPFPFFT